MFADCSSEAEVQHWMRYNIFLLLDVGTFSALVELLNMEIEYVLTVVIHRVPYNMDRRLISSFSIVFSSQ